jgi:hypothetical protein
MLSEIIERLEEIEIKTHNNIHLIKRSYKNG